MPSIRVVVVGIENPAQNDASGPRHARVQLTRYLHVLLESLPFHSERVQDAYLRYWAAFLHDSNTHVKNGNMREV